MANVGNTEANTVSTMVNKDAEQILHLHKEWWAANFKLDVPRMRKSFALNDKYLMFNLQGHPYYGLEEQSKLWEYYQSQIEYADEHIVRIVRFEIRGDMAWIASETVSALASVGDHGLGGESTGIKIDGTKKRNRATEIYHRDDGNGNPEWKMWHFHSSPAPDADEPRPAFGDTARSRGELIP